MNMRTLLASLIALPMLVACTVGPDRRVVLNTLVGQPETEAIRQLGVPDRSFDSGGRRFLAFVDRRVESFGGVGFVGRYGTRYGGFTGIDAGPNIYERVCETTLEVVDGRVATYALRGNACF
jgi:hypothetical protein